MQFETTDIILQIFELLPNLVMSSTFFVKKYTLKILFFKIAEEKESAHLLHNLLTKKYTLTAKIFYSRIEM